eukprot:765269-Hanusia_phi.AAC.10
MDVSSSLRLGVYGGQHAVCEALHLISVRKSRNLASETKTDTGLTKQTIHAVVKQPETVKFTAQGGDIQHERWHKFAITPKMDLHNTEKSASTAL